MAIGNTSNLNSNLSSSTLPVTTGTSTDSNTSAASSDKLASAKQASQLSASGLQSQLNVSILQASLQVSISSQNDSLTLIYKSVIANVSESVGIKDGSATQATPPLAAQDNSPEATAGRIVSFITNMFQLFKQNNPDKSDSDNIDDYMQKIYQGVDKGFSEARGILDSMKVLSGDIASNIDKTYDLVQKSLKDFIDQIKNPKQQDAGGNGGSVVASQTSVSMSISISQTSISTTA